MRLTYRFVILFVLFLNVSGSLHAFINATHGLIMITEYGANESREKTINTASTEKNHPVGLGATSKMFLTALYQEAAPILIPAPLLRVVLDHTDIARNLLGASADYFYQTYCLNRHFKDPAQTRTLHAYGTYLDKLYQTVDREARQSVSAATHEQALWDMPLFDASSAPRSFDETSSTWHEAIAYLICYYAPWHKYEVRVIKQGQYYFYLCVPKRLLGSSVSERHALRNALRYEPYCVIQDMAHYTVPCPCARDAATLQYEYDESLYQVLQQILIPKTGTGADPVWTFYCMGHGSFCYDACEKMNEQLNNRNQCLRDRALFATEEQRWNNESAQWKQKQHADRVYDQRHHAYVFYDQQAVRYNVEVCGHNLQTCKQNQTVCDQNLATIQHNMMCIACSNTVAGISQPWFKKIMQLFNTQIKTTLLFYRSCSAGGQQLVDLFTDDNNQPLRLPYTVIVGTLCEAASSTFSPLFHLTWFKNKAHNLFIRVPVEKLIDKQRHTVALDSHYDLNAFFNQTQQTSRASFDVQACIESVNPVVRVPAKPVVDDEQVSLISMIRGGVDSVIKNLWGNAEAQEMEREDIANIPSIRLPYETEFHVIDLHNTILSLTTKECAADMSSSCTIHAPYEVVLVYAPSINKTVRIATREHGLFPAFVSMIPGAAYHSIEKLDAQSYPLSTILAGFFTCTELKAPKLFYIKEIDGINDMLNQVSIGFQQTLTHVYIFNDIAWNKTGSHASEDHVNGIMFDCQNRTYLLTWPAHQSMPQAIPQRNAIQTISGYQQKNIYDLLIKQCCNRSPRNESYGEPMMPVFTVRDIERKYR